MVKTQESREFDLPAGLFKSFPDCSVKQGFVRFKVPGGLIEHRVRAICFFDHQKQTVFFDDSGNGAVGEPDHTNAESQ